MTLSALGDTAVLMTLGANIDEAMAARVRALAAAIERHPPSGVVDVVPAFASVAVFYDLAHFGDLARLRADLELLASRADISVVTAEARRVEIPVCYGGEFGPDLAVVGARHALSDPEVITLQTSADYLVHAIGFVPGFPYLSGLPEKLATPRRVTPRTAGGGAGAASARGTRGRGSAGDGVWKTVNREMGGSRDARVGGRGFVIAANRCQQSSPLRNGNGSGLNGGGGPCAPRAAGRRTRS